MGAHCRAISHRPADLVAAHVAAFITPQTRFARLRFHFADGTVMEPVPYFYELEAAWTQKYGAY
jgi:hexokinase